MQYVRDMCSTILGATSRNFGVEFVVVVVFVVVCCGNRSKGPMQAAWMFPIVDNVCAMQPRRWMSVAGKRFMGPGVV